MKKKHFKYFFLISSTYCLTACSAAFLTTIIAGTVLYGGSNNWETTDEEHQKIMNCLDRNLEKLNIHFENNKEKYKDERVMNTYYKCIGNPNYF